MICQCIKYESIWSFTNLQCETGTTKSQYRHVSLVLISADGISQQLRSSVSLFIGLSSAHVPFTIVPFLWGKNGSFFCKRGTVCLKWLLRYRFSPPILLSVPLHQVWYHFTSILPSNCNQEMHKNVLQLPYKIAHEIIVSNSVSEYTHGLSVVHGKVTWSSENQFQYRKLPIVLIL